MKIRYVAFLLFLSNVSRAESVCNLKLANLENQGYEEILRYANKVRKQACINTVLKTLGQYPNIPQADALESVLIRYRCYESCSEAEEKTIARLQASSCKKGFIDICLALLDDNEKVDHSKKLIEAKKYCDRKSSYACLYLGLELQGKEKEESLKYIKLACELKSQDACSHLRELEKIKSFSVK